MNYDSEYSIPFYTTYLAGLTGIFDGLTDLTTVSGLTALLSGSNIDYNTATTTEILSAFNIEVQKLTQTIAQNLSTEVIHPYDAIKNILFGSEYKFQKIEDVEVPEDITHESLISNIKKHESVYRENLLEYMHNKENYNVAGFHDHVSILSELSGENCFTVTDNRFKNYIEAIEMINNIDREKINETNYLEYYKKIGYCLSRVLTRRTV